MSSRDLALALEALPDEASVPVRWIRGLMASRSDDLVDLTLADISEKTGKAVSTVRGWCASGELRAYKLNGKEWRIPASALREFFDEQGRAA